MSRTDFLPRRRGFFRRSAIIVLFAIAIAGPSFASHFRFAHTTWAPRQDIAANAVDFTVQAAWRRSAYRSNNDRCISAATLNDVACTGPGGAAGVGDIVHERQGNSRFNPGDSSGLIGGPGSLSEALLFLVTSIDVDNDWLFGTALDPDSLPDAAAPYDTKITHVYPTAGNFTAHLSDCCRLSECQDPSAHMNNPDQSYRVETRVNVGTGKSSPVSNLPPIVICPDSGLCQFTIPVSDNDLDPVTFRLSTTSESGLSRQPGTPQCPNSATVNPITGVYSWNTTGCRTAASPGPAPPNGGCNDPDLNTLYSSQVMLEEPPGGSRVALDFLIQLVSSCELGNQAPVFDGPTPPCGSTLSVNPGSPVSFTVRATDPDATSVQLNATGLPSGASMTPGLPVSGQPASSSFSWTPGAQQEGQYVVVFNATDGCASQTLCSITIDVSNEVCDDGVDNDGDTLADCADPDCSATACNDGSFCTISDRCNAGTCAGTPRDCDDANECTVDSCDEGANVCVQDAASANGSSCEDGQFCTDGDTCASGTCVSGPPRDCTVFGGSCTTGLCNESADQCEPEPANDGSACDDGLFCTSGEFCSGGSCAGGSVVECNDDNGCTSDVCSEDGDQCLNDVLPGCCGNGLIEQGEECDDGNQGGGDGCEADCMRSTECSFDFGGGNERFAGGCGAPSFADVQAAVDASSDGDVVTVCPGTFVGSVVVHKEIVLRSFSGAATTELRATGTTVDVRRSGVAIEGLTIVSEAGAAIAADSICPLGQSSCSNAAGSNLRIVDNVIRDSVAGVRWTSRVDCVQISSNDLVGNAAPISLLQASGPPAVLVEIGGDGGGVGAGNFVSGGGAVASIRVAGIEVSVVANVIEDALGDGLAVGDVLSVPVTVAANAIRRSAGNGIVVGNVADGTSIVENDVEANAGDGIRILPGAAGAVVRNNNITDNGVGLGNEAAMGSLDARLNWWDSQTGPSGLFTGVGDSIENRAAGTTQFIEFLCRPFPEGFASVDGLCSIETAELRQLVPGRRPDLDPFGRFIVFETTRDLDVDARSSLENSDGSQEVFVLDRRPRPKLGGICLGGLLPCDFDNVEMCTQCNGNAQCPGDPAADPIVLNGECVQVTQLTDGAGVEMSGEARITGRGKEVFCATTADQMGSNPDGSAELFNWNRKRFEKGGPAVPMTLLTSETPDVSHAAPAPSISGRVVALESNSDPLGENPDGNTEIFLYSPRKDEWYQVTRTTGFCSASGEDCVSDDECEGPGDSCQPVENRLPATVDGRRVVFDSTGDLHNDHRRPGFNNPDHNREIFIAKMKKTGLPVITQVTDSVAPVDNRAPTGDTRAKLVAFSSNGDYAGLNDDGSREIFVWSAKDPIEQITNAPAGESTNPVIGASGRWLVFESTSDLELNGATNRRVFQFDRELGELLALSRLRFGTNQLPRLRRRRFVTWESTANLTGGNPSGEWVIFVFDRKKNDD